MLMPKIKVYIWTSNQYKHIYDFVKTVSFKGHKLRFDKDSRKIFKDAFTLGTYVLSSYVTCGILGI